MDNIRVYAGFMLVICLLAFTTHYYKKQATKLTLEINALHVKSKQLFDDKQAEKDKIESAANTYLRKAKSDYDKIQKSVKSVSTINADSLRGNVSNIERNIKPEIQEPASVVKSECQVKYETLWQTWRDLCLIYGCED